MSEFRDYKRTSVASARKITEEDIDYFKKHGDLYADVENSKESVVVSISAVDRRAGSPKIGDMIARNTKDHSDQWLVSKEYFFKNFKL